MNRVLLAALATAALAGNANAASLYDRFMELETEMKVLQTNMDELEAQNIVLQDKILAKEDGSSADEDEKDDDKAKSKDEDSDDDADVEDDEDSDDDGNVSDDEDDDDDDEEDFQTDTEDALEMFDKRISTLNKNTTGNHLKFAVDYRFSIDNLSYTMAGDGSDVGSKVDKYKNAGVLSNRLWLNMSWLATKHLSFTGQLAYNKTYGARSGAGSYAPFENFDWIASENPYDDIVRVKSAYFFYRNDTFLGAGIPWTFSIGRRPSTNGHIVNMRDDDRSASPMGHNINVEFDGLSSKFSFDSLVPGMYIKFCAGRGGTNANPRFFSLDTSSGTVNSTATPYATNKNDVQNIDLGGAIFTLYNDGVFSLATQYYYAANLIDAKFNQSGKLDGFETVGGLHAFTGNLIVSGLGGDSSDFLDDTTFFISGAYSLTDPKSDKAMLYNQISAGSGYETGLAKAGYSIWTGVQVPSLLSENGKWGVEYNYGSRYWRSVTYGEDTLVGSKLATRGSAYEGYMTEYLIKNIFSLQVRYTYINYKYTGSNGFFGSTSGTSIKISDLDKIYKNTGYEAYNPANTVSTAQDIRFYLRYKY